MLFSLGEMVTATQSVGDETFELLGEELNYVVEIVSPEDEDRELLESFDIEFGSDEGDESDLAIRPPATTLSRPRRAWAVVRLPRRPLPRVAPVTSVRRVPRPAAVAVAAACRAPTRR
jgi:hypothetical protein